MLHIINLWAQADAEEDKRILAANPTLSNTVLSPILQLSDAFQWQYKVVEYVYLVSSLEATFNSDGTYSTTSLTVHFIDSLRCRFWLTVGHIDIL